MSKTLKRGICKAKLYKDNRVVLVNPLVCHGGYGQPQCEYYRECLKDHGIRLTKDGKRMRKILIVR